MKPGALLISLLLLNLIYAEYFSSFAQLQKALEYVRKSNLNAYLDSYISYQRSRLESIKLIQAGIEELETDNAENVQNPLEAFSIVSHVEFIRTLMSVGFLQDSTHNFDKEAVLNITELYPTDSDLEGSAVGIVNIQEVHNLKLEDIADGLLKEHKSKSLTVQELISIAKAAQHARLMNMDSFKYASMRGLEFLGVALTRADSSDAYDLYTTFVHLVKNIDCTCTRYHHVTVRRILDLDPSLEISVACPDPGDDAPQCEALRTLEKFKMNVQMSFEALCRGEKVPHRPDVLIHKRFNELTCRYVNNNDPRLLLAPGKVEELFAFNPQITIIHDIIEERHVEFFMGEARDKLKRGPATFLKQGRVKNYHKVSQQHVLAKNHSLTTLKHLRERISALTRLTLNSFENIMVVNYASGGIYGVHMDAYSPYTIKNYTTGMKNRMVTIIIYLNDVSDGGETVFPNLGIRVRPKKYAALMFYNMYRSCYPNDFAEHSSCPVVYGTKWIANQWIGSRGQEFHYPCTLSYEL